jgi:hypothetical protein
MPLHPLTDRFSVSAVRFRLIDGVPIDVLIAWLSCNASMGRNPFS